MEELSRCPFCGGEAEYNDNVTHHWGLDVPGVECLSCGVRNFANTKEEAVSAWNRRT